MFRKYLYYLGSIWRLLTGIHNPLLVLRIFLGLEPRGTKQIRLRGNGVRFQVRGPMDIWIVKETYLNRFYERFGTAIGDGWAVVDIGAGIGDFSLYAALNHPRNRVCAFEPFPESFQLLQSNLRLNGATNVQAFGEAITGQSGTLELDLSSGEPLQFSTETGLHSDKTLTVPSLSLVDAFRRCEIERCDLLKMDCEGAEYDILFNAPDSILERVGNLVMEYHDGVTGYSHADLIEFFTGKGYKVRTQPNPVHSHLGFLHAFRGQVPPGQ